jgi:hypothetical protein
MLTRTKVAISAAFVLASASGALAQNLMGDGIPNEVYSGYGNYGPAHNAYNFGPGGYGFGDEQEVPAPHARGPHHHHR